MLRIFCLDPDNPNQSFPHINEALNEPNGLLAIGGCLSRQRLLNAYRQGIFPWYNKGDPILWWSPDPRLVLFPDQLNVSRSLHKTLRKTETSVTWDQAFIQVIEACSAPRKDSNDTWISNEIQLAYIHLHEAGHAHSVETWHNGQLVGGLYGVAIGQVFFGESMFHRKSDASKIAFVSLVQFLKSWGYQLIDCQVETPHLKSLGAQEIDRRVFAKLLDAYCEASVCQSAWKMQQ